MSRSRRRDPNIVWVGTGENNPRTRVSYGDGVYKSTDGGKTWRNMGLKKSFQIGRIIIHPKDPNIVYVGALGRLYGPNEERGLFKTEDGGKTWKKILYVDDKTGVIDMRMDPFDPNTLLVGMWERKRDGFDGELWAGDQWPTPGPVRPRGDVRPRRRAVPQHRCRQDLEEAHRAKARRAACRPRRPAASASTSRARPRALCSRSSTPRTSARAGRR